MGSFKCVCFIVLGILMFLVIFIYLSFLCLRIWHVCILGIVNAGDSYCLGCFMCWGILMLGMFSVRVFYVWMSICWGFLFAGEFDCYLCFYVLGCAYFLDLYMFGVFSCVVVMFIVVFMCCVVCVVVSYLHLCYLC